MARSKKTYEARTGLDSRAAKVLATAMFKKVEFIEDEAGHIVRAWKSWEGNKFTNDHIRSALRNKVALEAGEMLGLLPPAGINYCVNKNFLMKKGELYFVTLKAAIELGLPTKFVGVHHGRNIPFVKTPTKAA
jgi:hypothetical protein